MYLFQKFGYTHKKLIESREEMDEVIRSFNKEPPQFMAFDTETTGLNNITDIPFLLTFGWEKNVYGIDLRYETAIEYLSDVYDLMRRPSRVFAHNAKYDYHMMTNYGYPVPDDIQLADSQTVARLTNYADMEYQKSLALMGALYVDPTAKFAGKVIDKLLNDINRRRKKELKIWFTKEYPSLKFTMYWELLGKRVQYVETPYDSILDRMSDIYKEATFLDAYIENPSLMLCYALDDVVIIIEWMNKALPVLMEVDKGLRTFNQECDLIRVGAEQERVGFLADIPYLLDSRKTMLDYQEELYAELREKSGIPNLTSMQNAVIQKLFERKFGITLSNVDGKALRRIEGGGVAQEVAMLIKELRTVDKWLSTYVDGTLNRIVNGRIYTSVDSSGTVSGRVSSNLQQQPKEARLDRRGNELFHPRKAFLTDPDYELYFLDYSQQELRVQAYYTLLCSEGDTKLCRAYMPFKCISLLTGEPFDYKNKEVLNRWNSGEWVLEEDNTQLWIPTDVHDETTFTAFPYMERSKEHPDFKHNRKLGKVCNFLKNYQGGIDAIIDQLDVSEEIARILDKAYYDTFPVIRKYQKWVTAEMNRKGFIENLYGRRYYMQNQSWFYKVGNYLVQGTCADMVKQVEIDVAKLLKGSKSNFVLQLHDEIVVRVHKTERYLVDEIRERMETIGEVPWIPMIVEVEMTTTNWADKELVQAT